MKVGVVSSVIPLAPVAISAVQTVSECVDKDGDCKKAVAHTGTTKERVSTSC